MSALWYRILQFLRFYLAADTRFQVHSPFVFELAETVLEDRRWYYAFEHVEAIRRKMLESTVSLEVADYGRSDSGDAPRVHKMTLRNIVRAAASTPAQGRRLFRLVQWLKPSRMLEIGTSVGIGSLYLSAAARSARFLSLEGSESCVHIARANLGILEMNHRVEVVQGPFKDTLPQALQTLGKADLVFFDGHHREQPTLGYFNLCLQYSHDQTVLVFDDIYWSPEMTAAWKQIQQHPQVTLTVDCFDLGLAFVNPDFKVKQHFCLVPASWKPWKKW